MVGSALASPGMILLPAVPCTPRTNVNSGRLTTDSSSLPCVVKSSPWSAERGGVPDTIVTVPPCLPPELDAADELLLDELLFDEPPHATSASAAAAPSKTAAADLVSLFTDPPPQRSNSQGPKSTRRDVGFQPRTVARISPNQSATWATVTIDRRIEEAGYGLRRKTFCSLGAALVSALCGVGVG